MNKTIDHMLNSVIRFDCLKVLRNMPDACVDLIWTSPPYNLGNFNKGDHWTKSRIKDDKMIYKSHDDNMPDDKYQEWQHQVLNECYRILKDTGAIFYNHKPRIQNGVFDSRRNLVPFDIRQEIIWDRGGMINFSGSFYAPNTERIFIIAKDGWKPEKEFLKYGEVWSVSPDTNINHPCPFPYKLSLMVVQSASKKGMVVLDPFGGSGTTAIACLDTGRNFIIIEKDPDYAEMIRSRISKWKKQGRLISNKKQASLGIIEDK